MLGLSYCAFLVVGCSNAGVHQWRDGLAPGVSNYVRDEGLGNRYFDMAQPAYCEDIDVEAEQLGKICLREPRTFKSGLLVTAEAIGEDAE